MARNQSKTYRSPLGLNRWTLLAWYSVMLVFMSYIVGCPDLVRRLLILNNTAGESSENTFIQKQAIENIVNRGFVTATASSFIVASFCAYDTPRMNGVWALVMFVAGNVLLFVADTPLMNTAGVMLVSATFAASFNAHVSITALFPTNSEMVYDVLAALPDTSTLVPYLILWIFKGLDQTGGEANPIAMRTAVQIYVGIVTFASFIHLITVPAKPFNDLVSQEYAQLMDRTPQRQKVYSAKVAKLSLIQKVRQKLHIENLEKDYLLSHLTIIEQAVHPLFWAIGFAFGSALFRKYHVLTAFRFTVFEYATLNGNNLAYAHFLCEAMNVSNAMGWISATFIARLSSHCSAWLMGAVISVVSLITCAALATPSVHAQWITVGTMFIWSSLIYTYLFIALSDYFGKTNVSNLQGLQMLIGSLWSYGHPLFMEVLGWPFIVDEANEATYYAPYWHNLRAFEVANYLIVALSVLALIMPLYEWRLLTRHVQVLRVRAEEEGKKAPRLPVPLNRIPAPVGEERELLLNVAGNAIHRTSEVNEDDIIAAISEADFSNMNDVNRIARLMNMPVDQILSLGMLLNDSGSDEEGVTAEELSSRTSNGGLAPFPRRGDLGMGNVARGFGSSESGLGSDDFFVDAMTSEGDESRSSESHHSVDKSHENAETTTALPQETDV